MATHGQAREQAVQVDQPLGLVAGAAVSLLGLATHNTLEFGAASLLDPATGFMPMLVAYGALVVLILRAPALRLTALIALAGLALLNLVGGAVLSVLPLGFLPFEPEQSLGHYLSHVLYGINQLPLIWVALKLLLNESSQSRRDS